MDATLKNGQSGFTLKFSELLNQFLKDEECDWFCDILNQMHKDGKIAFWPTGGELRTAFEKSYPEVFETNEYNNSSCFIRGWVNHRVKCMSFFHVGITSRQSRILFGEFLLTQYGDRELNIILSPTDTE